MGIKSVVLSFVTAGAVALAPLAVAAPASAAPVTSSAASATVIVPGSARGELLCSGNLCLQRITTVEDNEAYVEAWANTQTFTGLFVLYNNGNEVGRTNIKKWSAGGPGWLEKWPAGGGYLMVEFRSDGVVLGQKDFKI